MFFVEQFIYTRHTQDDADAFVRPPEEISGEPVVFEVIGDDHGHAARGEDVRAREEIAPVYLRAAGQQIAHRQFHQREDGLVRYCGVFFELARAHSNMSRLTYVTGRKLPRSTRTALLCNMSEGCSTSG